MEGRGEDSQLEFTASPRLRGSAIIEIRRYVGGESKSWSFWFLVWHARSLEVTLQPYNKKNTQKMEN